MGIARNVYSISSSSGPSLNDNKVGPKPMLKLRTLIPWERAPMKCPSSWTATINARTNKEVKLFIIPAKGPVLAAATVTAVEMASGSTGAKARRVVRAVILQLVVVVGRRTEVDARRLEVERVDGTNAETVQARQIATAAMARMLRWRRMVDWGKSAGCCGRGRVEWESLVSFCESVLFRWGYRHAWAQGRVSSDCGSVTFGGGRYVCVVYEGVVGGWGGRLPRQVLLRSSSS